MLGENKTNTLKNQMIPSEKVKQKMMVVGREGSAIKHRTGKYYAPEKTRNKKQLSRKR